MTQIVFGVSICCNNSKYFRKIDISLSTQCLPIHPDLEGLLGISQGFGWKAANQIMKLNGNIQTILFIKIIKEVFFEQFCQKQVMIYTNLSSFPAQLPLRKGVSTGNKVGPLSRLLIAQKQSHECSLRLTSLLTSALLFSYLNQQFWPYVMT